MKESNTKSSKIPQLVFVEKYCRKCATLKNGSSPTT
jgi:hypothetical protein